jgi:hypothetical protein
MNSSFIVDVVTLEPWGMNQGYIAIMNGMTTTAKKFENTAV